MGIVGRVCLKKMAWAVCIAIAMACPSLTASVVAVDDVQSLASAIAGLVDGTSWDNGTIIVLQAGTDAEPKVYDLSSLEPVDTEGPTYFAISKKYVTIRSSDVDHPNRTVITGAKGEAGARAFYTTQAVRLAGLTCTGLGNSSSNGGVINSTVAGLNVSNCVFSANCAKNGGAMYLSNYGGKQSFVNTAFNGNVASADAAVYCKGCVFMRGCGISNNVASSKSCAITAVYGASDIRNCSFFGNSTGSTEEYNGAAICVNSDNWITGDTWIEDCSFSCNTAKTSVAIAGMQLCQNYGKLYVRRCAFENNYSFSSSKGYVVYGAKKVFDSGFTNNQSVASTSSAWLYGGAIGYNTAVAGLYATNCSFVGNSSSGGQNAFGAAAEQYTCADCFFSDNRSRNSNPTGKNLIRCFVTQCKGTCLSDGVCTNCVFTENLSVVGPGKYVNCLFKGGVAPVANNGSFHNCTFTQVRANGVYGVVAGNYAQAPAITMENCLLCDNETFDLGSNDDWKWPIINPTNCVFSAIGSRCTVYGDESKVANSSAKIKACLEHGCQTNKTTLVWDTKNLCRYVLGPKSSAIDAGYDIGWTAKDRDLFGQKRVIGSAVDIGCGEFKPTFGLMLLIR